LVQQEQTNTMNNIDKLKESLDEVAARHVNDRPIPTLEAYAQEIAEYARKANRPDVITDLEAIIQKVKDTYDTAVKDLELLADFVNNEILTTATGIPNGKPAGYFLTLLLRQKDGTKVTVSRTIKLEQKDAVEKYFDGKNSEVTEEELAEFDKFLSTI